MNDHPNQHENVPESEAMLTAFVLGELDAAEAAELTRRLEREEPLRQEVESIRAAVELIGAELATEEAPGLTPEQREAIEQGELDAVDDGRPSVLFSFLNARTLWGGIGLAAAACLIVAVWIGTERAPERDPVAFSVTPPVEAPAQTRSRDQSAPRRAPASEKGTIASVEPMEELAAGERAQITGQEAPADTLSIADLPRQQDDLFAASGANAVEVKDVERHAISGGETDVRLSKKRGREGKDDGSSELALRLPVLKLEASPAPPPAPGAGAGGAVTGGVVTGQSLGGGEEHLYYRRGVESTARASTAQAGAQLERTEREVQRFGDIAVLGDLLVEIEEDVTHDDPEVLGRLSQRIAGRGNREAYGHLVDNPFRDPGVEPRSTLSIDVDTASYANVRRMLEEGRRPDKDAVRIEEMINYFDYAYEPATGEHPFSVNVETGACPWNASHRLVRIGLKGRVVEQDMRPATSLVFLLDVSGSMNEPNKLPLVKQSLKTLVEHLTADDRIAIAVYAGASGLVLPSTYCDEKEKILAALDRLEAGGSTNGGAGIELAYRVAEEGFIDGGVNRVILCTDGDLNVGVTSAGDLVRLIETKRETGVFLSVLGFGTGNWQDDRMEQLSNAGNGNFAYIDKLDEAKKVLVEEMSATLVTIAKDVKIRVEFNPAHVGAYRLIGYANRVLEDQDFNDDRKDAGEIGAGHTVTALYEIVPPDGDVPESDPLVFQKTVVADEALETDRIMRIELRYKEPDGETSKLMEQPVIDGGATLDEASEDFRFASAVAAFGMLLRDSAYRGDASFETVLALAGGHPVVDDALRATAPELVEDFTHYARIARPDLSRAFARELVELSIGDGDLAALVDGDAERRAGFEKALGLLPATEDADDPVDALRARIERGRAMAGTLERSRRRAEFVKLVERAREIMMP